MNNTARIIDTFVDRREAQLALQFALQHDWGAEARLARDCHGDYWLVHLVDAYTHDGELCQDYTAIPATLYDAQQFGGY